MRVCLEVQREILPVRPSQHPGRQRIGIGYGEAGAPDLVGEFDDRCGTQATIEVVVEHDLEGATDALEGRGPASGPGGVLSTPNSNPFGSRARGVPVRVP